MVDLKTVRENANLTQEQLAQHVKRSRSVITQLETNPNYKPSVTTAKRIGKVLGFDWVLFFRK